MVSAREIRKLRLPVSVDYGPAEIAVTAGEYASAGVAAQALTATTAALATKAGWPGVPGPYTAVATLPGPLGDATTVWSADGGKILLAAMRVNNWVVTSAVGGASLGTAWTIWLEQVHRIEAVPRPTPVTGSGGLPTATALPKSDEGPIPVGLDGVPLGTATWTSAGYALAVAAAVQALGLAPERTGAMSLNLQGTGLTDNGVAPPVIAPPRGLILSPASVWGVAFNAVAGSSASNAALQQATPSIVYQLTDWGRLGSYAIEFDTKPRLAAQTGAPDAIYVGLVEFTTAAGAYQAVKTEAGTLAHIHAGARPMALGDLSGPGGVGTVQAVTARVFGKKVTSRNDWFLFQVDNWEVLVGTADPSGYYTPRTVWPYLTALAQNISLDGHAAP
jgi:hypothetical protein